MAQKKTRLRLQPKDQARSGSLLERALRELRNPPTPKPDASSVGSDVAGFAERMAERAARVASKPVKNLFGRRNRGGFN